jgi:hypothetical protein
MYPYTKELELEQALQLPLDTIVYSGFNNVHDLNDLFVTTHYQTGNKLYCDALTYATHILKQKTPPQGWGYAAYELSSGRYDNLNYYYSPKIGQWKHNLDAVYSKAICDYKNEFHRWAFRLTDLARVEGTDTDKTEINAAQVEWLLYNNPTIERYYNNKFVTYAIDSLECQSVAKSTDSVCLLTSTYNALPQEFHDLASSEMETTAPDWEAKYKQEKSECERLRKALFESEAKYNKAFLQRNEKDLQKQIADLEAKNKELANAGLNIAYDLATGSQSNEKNLLDRIAELEKTLQIQLKHIETLENQNSDLSIKYSKLSQYAINNLINNL